MSNRLTRMKRRWSLAIAVVGFLAIIALSVRGFLHLGEPTYQGHTVNWWISEQARTTNMIGVRTAFKHIGAEAVPYIMARLKDKDSGFSKAYRAMVPHLPWFIQCWLPSRPLYQTGHAAQALGAIGPVAIPKLIPYLHEKVPYVRETVFAQLHSFQSAGFSVAVAVPKLISFLENRETRCSSAELLAAIGPPASNAVPALLACLKSSSLAGTNTAVVQTKAACVKALGAIGPLAVAAVPVLFKLGDDPNRPIRAQAAIALWRITRRPTSTIPSLIAELTPSDRPSDQLDIMRALEEMGPSAASAAPAVAEMLHPYEKLLAERERLTKLAEVMTAATPGSKFGFFRRGYDPEPDYRAYYTAATNTLWRIDPATAKQVIRQSPAP